MLLAAAAVCAFGAACDPKIQSEAALTAHTSEPQAGMGCSTCHAYILGDKDHQYHLFQTDGNNAINGSITCLDCHATSILSKSVMLLDSVFLDSMGNEWHSLDFPLSNDGPSIGDTLRNFPLEKVDTLTQNHPVPVSAGPARAGDRGVREWMTGLAHMNGKVDVVFDPRVSDTAKYHAQAGYSPEQESCSAIACHPSGEKPFRFADPARGFKTTGG